MITQLNDEQLDAFALRWERAKQRARARLAQEAADAEHRAREEAIEEANRRRNARLTPLVISEDPRPS